VGIEAGIFREDSSPDFSPRFSENPDVAEFGGISIEDF
jgi:hypothetical protein